MIKGLVIQKLTVAGKKYEYPDTTALVGKINELADAVNKLQKDYDNVCIWVGEQKLKTPAENVQPDSESRPENVQKETFVSIDEALKMVKQDHKIRSTNERFRRALNYAVDVIQTVAKMADKHSRYDSFEEQLRDIQAYCWQEGYILTHEEELNRAITKGGDNDE